MISAIKNNIKNILAGFYFLSKKYRKFHRGKIVILGYHRILPKKKADDDYVLRGMYVDQNAFEKQIVFLKKNYKILSLEEFLQLDERKKLIDHNEKYCVITFDDGWRDNYDYAFPVLKKYNVSATIFLATSFINTNQIFWPERLIILLKKLSDESNKGNKSIAIGLFEQFNFDSKYIDMFLSQNCRKKQLFTLYKMISSFKQKKVEEIYSLLGTLEKSLGISENSDRQMLNWDEIKKMEKHNISFGPHGKTHKILTTIEEDVLLTEIIESKNSIDKRGIRSIPVFCYPNGNFNTKIKMILHQLGFKAAMSTSYGPTVFGKKDKYSYERILVHQNNSKNLPLFSWSLIKSN